MSAHERLLDTIADAHAATDEAAEDGYEAYVARLVELLAEPSERRTELWAEEMAEQGLAEEWVGYSLAELVEVPQSARGPERRRALEAVWFAAAEQVLWERGWLPVAEAALGEARRLVDEAGQLTPSQLRDAAAEGPRRARFDAAKAKRRESRGG